MLSKESTRGGPHPVHEGGGAPPPYWVRPPVSWAPGGSPPLMPAPTHFIFYPKKSPSSSSPSSSSFCCDFQSLSSKAPFTKLLWEIVAWYVTPPLVQLVFVLVLYSLQILAALVTLFLSLHVKFMRSQVIPMHDIGSRHL